MRQSGGVDARGPISKHGPKYLRWALFEAALHACKHRVYAERYQATKRRLGRQRGPKVARIDLARKLTEAIRHMLGRNRPFAPAGAPFRLAPDGSPWNCTAGRALRSRLVPATRRGDRDMSAARHQPARGP